jgi:hypothetical protein
MIYVLCIIINYLAMLPRSLAMRKACAVGAVLFCGFFLILRGRVGTDVGMTYEPMVRNLDFIQGTEPLFLVLLMGLKPIFPTALMTVTMGLGLVFTLLLILYTLRCDERELFLLQAFLIPTQYANMAYSGQRFGLAYLVLLLGVQCYVRKQYVFAAALGIAALFTHYSVGLLVLIYALCVIEIKGKMPWILLTVGVLLTVGISVVAHDYFVRKFFVYFESSYERPNITSGLSTILLALLLLWAAFQTELRRREKYRLLAVSAFFLSLFFSIGLYSYGALRLLILAEWALVLAILTLMRQSDLSFSTQFRRTVVIVGVLGCLFFARNAAQEVDYNALSSPLLPYKFIWEEAQD